MNRRNRWLFARCGLYCVIVLPEEASPCLHRHADVNSKSSGCVLRRPREHKQMTGSRSTGDDVCICAELCQVRVQEASVPDTWSPAGPPNLHPAEAGSLLGSPVKHRLQQHCLDQIGAGRLPASSQARSAAMQAWNQAMQRPKRPAHWTRALQGFRMSTLAQLTSRHHRHAHIFADRTAEWLKSTSGAHQFTGS